MANKYTQGLIIDGVSYAIPFVEVKRTFDFLEKYADRTEDGDVHIETIGGYQNYQIKIGVIDDTVTYQRLYDQITDCTNRFHKVILPDSNGNFEFYGYFSSISDSMKKIYDSKVVFESLTWKMTEKSPTKTP